jgi:hypothetical protein
VDFYTTKALKFIQNQCTKPCVRYVFFVITAAAQEEQSDASAVISESDLRRERIRAASAGKTRIGGSAAVASKYTNVQQVNMYSLSVCFISFVCLIQSLCALIYS